MNFANYGEAMNWYLAAWVSNALNDAGIRPRIRVGPSSEGGSSAAVLLEGDGFRVEMSREETA